MSAPFSPYQSPKQSKLGSIGKKVMDALRQMEISADSWQAPGESNAGQGSWVRNSQPGSAGQWRPQQSREAMMLEVERQKCLRELKRLQEEDDQFRKKQSMQSPSEATSQGMRSHAQQHDQSARRLTQVCAWTYSSTVHDLTPYRVTSCRIWPTSRCAREGSWNNKPLLSNISESKPSTMTGSSRSVWMLYSVPRQVHLPQSTNSLNLHPKKRVTPGWSGVIE